MKLERITLASTYAMIVLVIGGVALAAWHRATDTVVWAHLPPDVHWAYDAAGALAGLFAVVVGVGLWFRREWGRILAISLCVLVFFMFLGIRLIGPFIIDVDIDWSSLIDIEAVVMGLLAIVNIVGLTHRSFKDGYSANSSLNTDARKESARAG